MRLDIIPDRQIENPGQEDIVAAIRQAYAEEIDALILLSDVENNQFMQVPSGGRHVEYCVGPKGPIYAAEDVSLELAIRLFSAYARGETGWKTQATWEVYIDSLGPAREPRHNIGMVRRIRDSIAAWLKG